MSFDGRSPSKFSRFASVSVHEAVKPIPPIRLPQTPALTRTRISINTSPAQEVPQEKEKIEQIEEPAPIQESQPLPSSLNQSIPFSSIKIAYFSIEIGLNDHMPTYAGGLGILAGDMFKSATDLGVPFAGISLLYRHGFVKQKFDHNDWQEDHLEEWNHETHATRLSEKVTLNLDGRTITVALWLYLHPGVNGKWNPLMLLDTDVEENEPKDREITKRLYGEGEHLRLLQEAVLGIGGIKALEILGAKDIVKYHMNEGHAALLLLPLLEKYEGDEEKVRQKTVFTTHTPAAGGHDEFPRSFAEKVLEAYLPKDKKTQNDLFWNNTLHLVTLGMRFAGHVNGVEKNNKQITKELFPGYSTESITNGVHAASWVSPHLKSLYDAYIPGWERDPYHLRYASGIPVLEFFDAHQRAKDDLIALVHAQTGMLLDPEIFTIGFARRASERKRPDLLFRDIDRLVRIAERSRRGIQIVFSGKAHPNDHEGKLLIQRLRKLFKNFHGKVRAVYLEDYRIATAKILIAGSDVWLNTPTRPQEASGTSGMKAAMNGVPFHSILDGWWLEGHVEGVTGWGIGKHPEHGAISDKEELDDLYAKLEYVILPRYESEREKYASMMRSTVSINGSFFHTHRVIEQYVLNTYFR